MKLLLEKGLTKHIGFSNFLLKEIKEAKKILKGIPISAIQEEYNIFDQEKAKGILDYCRKENIIFIATRPLAKGRVAKSTDKMILDLSKKYKKTASQIALKWLIQQDNVVAIPKSINIDHIKENSDIFDWELTKEELNGKQHSIQVPT